MLADDGTPNAVLGMAHRGRLSAIAHVVNRPYEELLAEFEAAHERGDVTSDNDVTGDVKYHHGATASTSRRVGTKIIGDARSTIRVTSKRSTASSKGMTRALQTDHRRRSPTHDGAKPRRSSIHGDAAFTGARRRRRSPQPAIASRLRDRRHDSTSSRTIRSASRPIRATRARRATHRISPRASMCRSCTSTPTTSRRASPRCISAIDFRAQFGRDVLIDLIGYRRFGHNEQDEPAYTQPVDVRTIKTHPTVRELFAHKLDRARRAHRRAGQGDGRRGDRASARGVQGSQRTARRQLIEKIVAIGAVADRDPRAGRQGATARNGPTISSACPMALQPTRS